MKDFSDPKNKLEGELEDLRMDIDRKEKEFKKIDNALKDLEKQKELAWDELEELRDEEERLMKDLERLELDL